MFGFRRERMDSRESGVEREDVPIATRRERRSLLSLARRFRASAQGRSLALAGALADAAPDAAILLAASAEEVRVHRPNGRHAQPFDERYGRSGDFFRSRFDACLVARDSLTRTR